MTFCVHVLRERWLNKTTSKYVMWYHYTATPPSEKLDFMRIDRRRCRSTRRTDCSPLTASDVWLASRELRHCPDLRPAGTTSPPRHSPPHALTGPRHAREVVLGVGVTQHCHQPHSGASGSMMRSSLRLISADAIATIAIVPLVTCPLFRFHRNRGGVELAMRLGLIGLRVAGAHIARSTVAGH